MSAIEPTKIWWTIPELAAANLPDLPRARQALQRKAERDAWQSDPAFARRRQGRGGGWEYHWSILPTRAKRALMSMPTGEKAEPQKKSADWAWYDALPEKDKATAQERLNIIEIVRVMIQGGASKDFAVNDIAGLKGVSPRTVYNWLAAVEGVDDSDRLPFLAPRHRFAANVEPSKDEITGRFMDVLKADYLRLERPSFTSCYERARLICEAEGASVLTERTARRRLTSEVSRVSIVFAREGEHGLAKCFPPQIRDRSSMVAMEGVNADCHKMDVFVRWAPDEKPSRAQIVGFQDIFSGKILSWRVDTSPNKVAVMAAFGDLIEHYGIPSHCLFDNGREFANKWLTGGAPTRFRFKIREDDPLGVLTQLGIKIHWATPGHGQAKPIERAFRDFADYIAKDPRFSGAYTGNKPDAKPEDYGSRAIDIEDFIAVVDEGVKRHNARLGRRSDTVLGASFDEAFEKSYATAKIRKASEEQRRLWLMGAEPRQLHKNDGGVTLHGNRYWSAWMNEYAGQKIIARFDPEDLHSGLYIYALDGAFLGMAACLEKVGFFDVTGAKEHSRKVAQIKRTERKLLAQHRTLKPSELGEALAGIAPEEPAKPDAKVVQLVKGDQRPTAARIVRKTQDVEPSAEEKAEVLAFQRKVQMDREAAEAAEIQETEEDRFLRALDLERRSEAGERLGEAETRWLNKYQGTAEYRGQLRMRKSFGDDAFRK